MLHATQEKNTASVDENNKDDGDVFVEGPVAGLVDQAHGSHPHEIRQLDLGCYHSTDQILRIGFVYML